MSLSQITQVNPKQIQDTSAQPISGDELNEVVGMSVVADLNEQLASISNQIREQVAEKQALRGEMESIYQMRHDKEQTKVDIEGQMYMELDVAEAELLGVRQSAPPILNDSGEVTGYRLKEDDFESASKAALEIRDEKLGSLNDNSEVTQLKIQSLIDQRKNAMMLLSNLLASANKTAEAIIGNIRG